MNWALREPRKLSLCPKRDTTINSPMEIQQRSSSLKKCLDYTCLLTSGHVLEAEIIGRILQEHRNRQVPFCSPGPQYKHTAISRNQSSMDNPYITC